jgi:uncharacterized membrane protein
MPHSVQPVQAAANTEAVQRARNQATVVTCAAATVPTVLAMQGMATVSIVRRRQSSRSAVSVAGLELRVATSDLPALLRWVPSLQRLIDALEADRR